MWPEWEHKWDFSHSTTMRKLILGVAVSLDGFIEGPNGEYDWCFTDQDYGLKDFFQGVDAIFMGRKSFEVAQAMGEESPWKGLKTYIFSRSLAAAPSSHTELVRSIEEARAILEQPGKSVWLFGGAELLTAFLNRGLVSELWLSVHPILLGSGKPLFQNLDGRKNLRLTESKTYDTGLVSLKYAQEG